MDSVQTASFVEVREPPTSLTTPEEQAQTARAPSDARRDVLAGQREGVRERLEQPERRPAGTPRPAPGPVAQDQPPRASGGWHRRMSRVVQGPWLRRQAATVWLNLLVLAAVALAYLTVWGGVSRNPGPDDISQALLKVFAVWCLAFLPGWLFVRFLGQRAAALWSDFVLHLHRLGCDDPQYLPMPPVDSPFHTEWLAAGGTLHDDRHNLYREKFDSYYGKSVADSAEQSDFAVRTDTMFPVFLATAMLAVTWVAVLWDTRFLSNPSSVWDILKFAFLGAYLFLVQSLIRRYFQNDLRPSAYASAIVRIMVVLLSMAALHEVLRGSTSRGTEAAVAFVVGFFPAVALQAMSRLVATTLRLAVPQLTPEYPLNQLDGLNVWYEARLVEEGIEDMQNLATADLVDVILHTRVPVGRLVDWVDQAHLYLHLDRAERSARERRASTRPSAGAGHAGAGATGPSAADGSQAGPARIQGSVGPSTRAGTQTRVALRQLGIRTATDLLKAFPPDQVDATVPLPGGAPLAGATPRFGHLLPAAGVDEDQIRTLVRVLDEAPELAAVWNWQSRGCSARTAARRPRTCRT